MSKKKVVRGRLSVALCFGLLGAAATASGAMDFMSMNGAALPTPAMANQWVVHGDVSFEQKEAFPNGLIVMKTAKGNDDPYVRLKGVAFENGTIEFDVKPLNDEWPTVRFRIHDDNNAEEFYIRPGADCSVAIDCLQYAPKMRGRMLWDSNYDYQRAAPFRDNEWNHVKLVVSGRRMNVYINHSQQPTLPVDELEGEGGAGSVELQGPATFTNIVVTPGATENLSPVAVADPTAGDRGYLRSWHMVTAVPLVGHSDPNMSDMPNAQAHWVAVHSERSGLVNLARYVDRMSSHDGTYYAWLTTNVHVDRDQSKQVQLGFLRVVTVFVNGQAVFSGKNLYNTPHGRQQPDGRLGLENGHFTLPLKKGDNKIVVALRSNTPDMSDQYGYGLRFHIENASGLNTER